MNPTASGAEPVKLVVSRDSGRWAAACRRSGQAATPFHSYAWLVVAAAMTRHTFTPLIVQQGGADVGVVPWLVRNYGPVRSLNYLPFPYAGPLVPSGLVVPTLKQVNRRALARRALVQEHQFAPGASFDVDALARSGYTVRRDSTYVVDTAGSSAQLWAALEPRCRNAVRQAAKKGVEITTEGDGAAALSRVMGAIGVHRGLSDVYPNAFPPSPQQLNQDGLEAYWSMARLGDDVVGCQVALLYEGVAVGWLGGVLPEHRGTRANVALYWDTIEWASQRGARSMDLVGVPNAGIDRFKSQFGARRQDYVVMTKMPASLVRAHSGYKRVRQARAQRRTSLGEKSDAS